MYPACFWAIPELRLSNDRIDWACESCELLHQLGAGIGMAKGMNVETVQELEVSLVRVLVVDDFDLWRGFVVSRLKERPDLQVVGVASDGLQAVQKAEELQPDLILLDVMLPKLNGIEAAQEIRRVAPLSKIIFVSSECDIDSVRTAFQAGGSGYVSKMEAAEGLLAGVEAVLRGERFVSPGLADSGNVTDVQESDSEDEPTAT
jgi:DNA-binding NarL/FixJ family response regulator